MKALPVDKKIIALVSLAIFLVLLPFASSAAGIVPCGGYNEPACTECHFAVLINNLVRFGIYNLALPLGVIMFMVAGLFYAFSGGDQKRIGAAKNTLKNAALGIFIVLVAWFFIDTAIKTLVDTPGKDNFISSFGPWNNPFSTSNPNICGSTAVRPEVPVTQRDPKSAISTIVSTIAKVFGTLIMAISVIMILLAAFRFTTAGGNEDSVSVARKMLIYALIGVAVALFAFVMPALVQTLIKTESSLPSSSAPDLRSTGLPGQQTEGVQGGF